MTCEHREMATAQSGIRVCAGCGKPLPHTAPAAESQPDDLFDFLRARLDDTERVAREALNHPGEWNAVTRQMEQTGLDDGVWSVGPFPGDECHIEGIGITIYDEGGHNEAQAKHIAEHDPARELREVEAKRAILDHIGYELEDHGADNPYWYDERLMPVLRLLALPHDQHPDYRTDWRPA